MAGIKQSYVPDKEVTGTIILEAIAAGLAESCHSLHLSALGRAVLKPLLGALSTVPTERACREVFEWVGGAPARQDFFLLGFMELASRRKGALKGLARQLEQACWIKETAITTGIGFQTLYCLLAVEFKERSREQGVLMQEGDFLRIARPRRS